MAETRVIDDNMHFLPTNLFTNEEVLHGFLYSAPVTFGMKAYLGKTPDGTKDQVILEYPEGKQILNYVDGDYTQAAEMCKRSEGRLVANAVLPPFGRKEDVDELKHCIEDLSMVGVQFACCYGDRFLDDELFKPYMKVLNDMKVPAVVHHTPGQNAFQNFDEYTILRRELGRIHAQAAAVGREIYSGMFDEFPNLKFVHTMFGGNWFGLQEILAPHKSTKKKEAMNRLATNVDHEAYTRYLENNIFFDMTHPMSWGKDQIECAVKVCGADHLLMGSSFPVFYEWMARSVESIDALDVTDEEKALMKGGNAARIFNL